MKKTLALASIVLLAGSLSSCGGDDGGSEAGSSASYCDLLQSAQEDFSDFDFSKLTQEQFDAMGSRIDDIQAAAPDDAAAEAWGTAGDMLTNVQSALSDAGVSLDDMQSLSDGDIPDGVDISKLQQLPNQLSEITGGDEIKQAEETVAESAKSECGIDMGDTAEPSSTPAS